MKKAVFLVLLACSISNTSKLFAQSKSPKFLGGWVTYEQQLGDLDNQFITYGGVTLGTTVFGIMLGLGMYGTYPFTETKHYYDRGFRNLYGGFIVGYKTPWKIVGARISVLLGAGSIHGFTSKRDSENASFHFVISPTLNIDFHIFKTLVLSVGLTYRYFTGYNEYKFNVNDLNNALAANFSVGWVY